MSQTIDIKTKKIIPDRHPKFNKTLVLENLERNILSHWDMGKVSASLDQPSF